MKCVKKLEESKYRTTTQIGYKTAFKCWWIPKGKRFNVKECFLKYVIAGTIVFSYNKFKFVTVK